MCYKLSPSSLFIKYIFHSIRDTKIKQKKLSLQWSLIWTSDIKRIENSGKVLSRIIYFSPSNKLLIYFSRQTLAFAIIIVVNANGFLFIIKKHFDFTFLLLSQHNEMLILFEYLQINGRYFIAKKLREWAPG